jgi:hypothetical protein
MTNMKEAWIEALKSGKYNHGQRRLKLVTEDATRHCCLGVLVEVLGDEIVGRNPASGENEIWSDTPDPLDGNRIKIKEGSVRSYNYFNDIIHFRQNRKLADLYTINDEYGVTDYTRQIRWIEENVESVEQKDQ